MRVPAGVIGVQMGTEDKVYVFRIYSCARHPLKKIVILPAPFRSVRTLLVVAGTGVDQKSVTSGAKDETLEGHNRASSVFVHVAWLELVGIAFDQIRRDARQKKIQRCIDMLRFDHPIEAKVSDENSFTPAFQAVSDYS